MSNDNKENIGKEFEDTLKFIFNYKKENVKKNIKRSFDKEKQTVEKVKSKSKT